ncbi:hypothetical protein EP56_05755 [Listeriaceae bacterium FSL A5-0209]|nr:hypothetical protein EP56_05755 [Listeriaceae bacterium FSL A5-0209]
MKATDLLIILAETGLPVAYSHFVETNKTKVPDPPYIVYKEVDSDNMFADNIVYAQSLNYDVELYTNKKDPASEALVEALFERFELPFNSHEVWIDSEKMFQKTYELRLI